MAPKDFKYFDLDRLTQLSKSLSALVPCPIPGTSKESNDPVVVTPLNEEPGSLSRPLDSKRPRLVDPLNDRKDSSVVSPVSSPNLHPMNEKMTIQLKDSQPKTLSVNEVSSSSYQSEDSDKTVIEGEVHYLIKWEGRDEAESSWIDRESIKGCTETLAKMEEEFQSGAKVLSVEEKAEHLKKTTEAHMKAYGVLEFWPPSFKAEKVEGVMRLGNTYVYIVRKSERNRITLQYEDLHSSNTVLVKSDILAKACPEAIIAYYESKMEWANSDNSAEEKDFVAKEMQRFAKDVKALIK